MKQHDATLAHLLVDESVEIGPDAPKNFSDQWTSPVYGIQSRPGVHVHANGLQDTPHCWNNFQSLTTRNVIPINSCIPDFPNSVRKVQNLYRGSICISQWPWDVVWEKSITNQRMVRSSGIQVLRGPSPNFAFFYFSSNISEICTQNVNLN